MKITDYIAQLIGDKNVEIGEEQKGNLETNNQNNQNNQINQNDQSDLLKRLDEAEAEIKRLTGELNSAKAYNLEAASKGIVVGDADSDLRKILDEINNYSIREEK